MRQRVKSGDLSVHAIAGTYVVLLGMNVADSAVDGLLGFGVERFDHTEGRRGPLPNFLLFEANDGANPDYSSLANPFQEFLRGDYTAKPDHDYTYRVTALYGTPKRLRTGATVDLRVHTEPEEGGKHAVHFNRGVANSQAYARQFGNKAPKDVPFGAAYTWLSRGLFEGLQRFIGRASGPDWGLRASVYEFDYQPVLEAFAIARDSGADVQIVFDNVSGGPGAATKPVLKATKLTDVATPRTRTKISHNKFVVLLRKGKPVAVWTGSTNITEGAIFGHSNVGHAVEDAAVAARYLDFWTELHGDPDHDAARDWTGSATPIPKGRPRKGSITTVFSPRHGLEALNWYAQLMDGARESVFLTAAFGVSEELRKVFEVDRDYLRYLLLDNRKGKLDTIRRDPDNRIVAGGYVGKGGWRQWAEERLTNLNKHVEFIHTKYMLVDPLGDDPTVITGSANFSEPSTTDNDENMLVIRGDQRVADIYLGEFMRLFDHYRLRGRSGVSPETPAPGPGAPASARRKLYLSPTDEWARRFYVAGSPEAKERLLFS